MIAAILRAQFLSMRFGRGAVFAVIAGIVWYGMWTALACTAAFLVATATIGMLRTALPVGFLAVCAYWQLIPIFSATMGSSLDMRKLLVYPAPHHKLFQVEVLLRLTSGVEMLLVTTATMIGLMLNRAARGTFALPRLAAGEALFVLFNLLLSSGLRSILERLMARRRVREVMALFVALLWALPRLLMSLEYRPKGAMRAAAALQAVGLPWTAMARIALPAAAGFPGLAWLSLACWTVLALWFGRMQFERSLRYDAIAAQATPHAGAPPAGRGWLESFYRLPSLLWRDPLATIVEKELRSLARTPRFRMVFIMGFTFGLAIWFPMIARGRGYEVSPYFLVIVSVYALTMLGQVSFWNSFGFDRSAAGFYFAAPQPIAKTLLGKNIAALIYVYLEVLILIAVTSALRLSAGAGDIARTLLAVGVCALYLVALGNISSVRYPRAMAPERVSQGGSSRSFNGVMFLLYPLTLVPVGLAYLAEYAFDSELAFGIVLALAAAIGGVLYWISMESAVKTAGAQREAFLQELSRGEGPVVSS